MSKTVGKLKRYKCTVCNGTGAANGYEEVNLDRDETVCGNCLGMGEIIEPYWYCENCGYKNYNSRMPYDREAFYKKISEGKIPKCPNCKSESYMPVGY